MGLLPRGGGGSQHRRGCLRRRRRAGGQRQPFHQATCLLPEPLRSITVRHSTVAASALTIAALTVPGSARAALNDCPVPISLHGISPVSDSMVGFEAAASRGVV